MLMPPCRFCVFDTFILVGCRAFVPAPLSPLCPCERSFRPQDIAAFIKKEFDKKYNATWHCIVGRNFGSYVTHETKHFIYFYLGQASRVKQRRVVKLPPPVNAERLNVQNVSVIFCSWRRAYIAAKGKGMDSCTSSLIFLSTAATGSQVCFMHWIRGRVVQSKISSSLRTSPAVGLNAEQVA